MTLFKRDPSSRDSNNKKSIPNVYGTQRGVSCVSRFCAECKNAEHFWYLNHKIGTFIIIK